MAISNFIPEVWSAALLKALRDRLVYSQAGVINRNYEGEIARAGDTVHITSFADPSVRSYTKYSTITWDQLTDSTQALVVDQADYFAFKVDDIDRRQALPGFVEETTVGASYNLTSEADEYASGLMNTNAGNTLTAATSVDTTSAYDVLVDLRTSLTKSNTPADGRWVVVPPEFYAVLLKDDRFIRADAAGTTMGLRNANVGNAAGFSVLESNTVPFTAGDGSTTSDTWTLIAGHSIATTYAEQIAQVKAVDLQDTFGEGVKGLHLYGGKVIRPDNLAKIDVDFG